MKQKKELIIYLFFMSLFITGALCFGKKGHGGCPVCKHSVEVECWKDTTEKSISAAFLLSPFTHILSSGNERF